MLYKQNLGARIDCLLLNSSISELLDKYQRLSLAPSTGEYIAIKGKISLNHTYKNANPIKDIYELLIKVPSDFPKSVPIILETGNKIPKHNDNHVNPDGTLCLGTPLKLQLFLVKYPSLVDFVERVLIPHLYAVSNKLNGGEFIFGELAHGSAGELSDYEDILGVKGVVAVKNALNSLRSYKKRIANKKVCPCGCGRRLGSCKTHFKLNSIRTGFSKNSFDAVLTEFNKRLERAKKY